MSLLSVQATNFRNISSLDLKLCGSCNLFYGANGSGKTSILEIIYFLSHGKSFRNHLLKRIIKQGSSSCSIFALLEENSLQIPVGIEKNLLGEGQIKIAKENVSSTAELARLIPVQLINQNSFRLFEQGPKVRRQFIDWGVFHVEPRFLSLWKAAERLIEQRNNLLRCHQSSEYLSVWERELCEKALIMHQYRSDFFQVYLPVLAQQLEFLLPGLEITAEYYPGWDVSRVLSEIFNENRNRDQQLGYTTFGPHRADLILRYKNTPVQDVLSRGQQKLVLIAMRIAHGKLLRDQYSRKSIYLVDDLTAELDREKSQLFADLLTSLDAQLFITGLDCDELLNLFSTSEHSLFHVEQGRTLPV